MTAASILAFSAGLTGSGCAGGDERGCFPLTVDPALEMADPYTISCTGPYERAGTTPCTRTNWQTRFWPGDGTFRITWDVVDFSGWTVWMRFWPDGCVVVEQQSFSDIGPSMVEPVSAASAEVTLSSIPQTAEELRIMGGELHAIFQDGVTMDARF
jgi:hypothetical protein